MFRRLKFFNRFNQLKQITFNSSRNIYNIESKFNSIENNVININNFYKFNNLLYLRSQGFCFIYSDNFNKQISTSLTSFEDILIFNDSPDFKIFIYDISVNFSDFEEKLNNVFLNVLFTANIDTTHTNTKTALNLKLDENDLIGNGTDTQYPYIYIHKNTSNLSNNDGVLFRKSLYTSPGTEQEFHNINLFQNEYIEIPENRGIVIYLSSLLSTTLTYSITVKFFIINNNFQTSELIFN